MANAGGGQQEGGEEEEEEMELPPKVVQVNIQVLIHLFCSSIVNSKDSNPHLIPIKGVHRYWQIPHTLHLR